jgi:hypothetical protein
MQEIYNPGICEITKASITPFGGPKSEAKDITALIYSFTIQQSIDSVSLFGSIKMLDNSGLLEKLPLRGEETLDFKIKSYDLQTEREIKATTYKIDNVSPNPNGNGVLYTIHFLSKHSFDANIKYFITSFKNKRGSDIVFDIFKKNYGQIEESTPLRGDGGRIPEKSKRYKLKKHSNADAQRYFYLQETFGNMSVIIPRLAPSEALGFIAERSFSDKDDGTSFRFFETFDGYYFVTDEWLLERSRTSSNVKSFDYSLFVDKNPEKASIAVNNIENFSNPRRVDVATEMMQGSYYNTIFEIDLLRHKVNRKDFKYLQTDSQFINNNVDNINLDKKREVKQNFKTMTNAKASASIDIHSEDFINKTFTPDNSKRFMVIRDYTQKVSDSGLSRNNTFYTEMAAQRNMYTRHLNATQVTISMKGRLDLRAGEVIRINVKELDSAGDIKQNPQLSGKYLIKSIMNIMENGVLDTVCQICKYDYSDAANDNSEVT